jgi:hypothetical protein
VLPFTLLLPPFLAFVLRPLTFGHVNYLPAGPTPILFALLAQYHAAIPPLYQYRIGTTSPSTSSISGIPSSAISFTSKSTNYFFPLQLALSQFPSSILPALVGWAVGYAYRNEILPGVSWRAPGWLVGQSSRRDAGRMEAMRRRLEGDSEVSTTGVDSISLDNDGARHRPTGGSFGG